MTTTITPCLWFDDNLEEAAEFYTSVFPNSSVQGLTAYTDAGPSTPGDIAYGTFVLDGNRLLGINGGQESQCGWLKDRYGLSWQIVPDRLYELLEDPDPAIAAATTAAMLSMRKIVVAGLEAAVGTL